MDDMYIGKILDGRYEILEKIGSGGMAVVYKARCHRLNRFVAVKILKSDLAQDPELRRRFHAESQAVAMLSHPNIVSVYDVNHTDNLDYIVMELIEGITLKQYINRKGILNWKEALHFTLQIVKALEHAHSRGIIHRDIKPHNIMILKDGNVKVADFGIARLLTTKNTLTQEALGSVHYISPEQAKGGAVDVRSDLYSVGVVMYEMLTSRLPFEGDSPVAVAIQHISAVPLQPREINPDIPIGLEDITMHAMDPNLNTRYPSATAMLSDLEEFRKNPSIRFNYSTIPSVADEDGNTRKLPDINGSHTSIPKKQHGNGLSRSRVTKDEYQKNRKKSGNTSVLVGIFCILVFLIGLVWFMWDYAGREWFSPEDEAKIDVPNFVGKMYDDVSTNPDYTKYYEFSVVTEESETYPEGYIINQDPSAKRSVLVSDTKIPVKLTVSSGAKSVLMPNLYNMNYVEAESKLVQLGLSLRIESNPAPSKEFVEGRVFEQYPEYNEPLVKGMTVYLTYSSGPPSEITLVPDLLNLTESQAMARLERANLVGKCETRYDAEVPAGRVCEQDIEKDTEVEAKTEITFYVSLGPELLPSYVPNLLGLTQGEAMARLQDNDLLGNPVESYNDAPIGAVYDQDPAPNTEVDQNTIVTFYVSLGPEEPIEQPITDTPDWEDEVLEGGTEE